MTATRRIEQLGLVATMFFGSIVMWLGAPAFWLWFAGRNSQVSASSMGSLLMVIIGIPVTMVLIGKLLARVDRRYDAGFGKGGDEDQHAYAQWLHTMRGGSDNDPPTMLEKIMVISLILAASAVGLWFLFFSGGSAFHA